MVNSMRKISNKEFVSIVIEDATHGDHAMYCTYMYECSRRLTLASVKKSASMTAILDGLLDILANKTDLSFLIKDSK